MNTIEKMDKLRERIAKGERSAQALKDLDPLFVVAREEYRSELVGKVRGNAQDREIILAAARIAALEDLYEYLYQDVVTGARAFKTATEMEDKSGS